MQLSTGTLQATIVSFFDTESSPARNVREILLGEIIGRNQLTSRSLRADDELAIFDISGICFLRTHHSNVPRSLRKRIIHRSRPINYSKELFHRPGRFYRLIIIDKRIYSRIKLLGQRSRGGSRAWLHPSGVCLPATLSISMLFDENPRNSFPIVVIIALTR